MYTYLLGAGASYKKLPLATGMLKSIINFVNELRSFANSPNSDSNKICMELVSRYNALIDKAIKHQTIDTYARMLWLKNQNQNLDELKFLLTFYFHYKQAFREADDRYDHFLATILEKEALKIPKEINILSWNYDYQMEKAISLYIDSRELRECEGRLGKHNIDNVDSNIYLKLNGTALFINASKVESNKIDITPDNKDINRDMIIQYLIDLYKKANDPNCSKHLTFAWENNIEMLNNYTKHLSKTKILIIIGYSFPYFNRSVDLKILQLMDSLDKIIIQSPVESAENLKSKLIAMWPQNTTISNKIEIVTDTDQFFIPYEYKLLQK